MAVQIDMQQLRSALHRLAARVGAGVTATVLVTVAALPHPCPPGPAECTCAVYDVLQGLTASDGTPALEHIRLVYATPAGKAIPPPAPGPIQGCMDVIGAECLYGHTIASVDADARTISFTTPSAETTTLEYDVCVAMFPYSAPTLLTQTLTPEGVSLVSNGWITVCGRTHRTPVPGVYAIGDNSRPMFSFAKAGMLGHPKAGSFSVAQGAYVAQVVHALACGSGPGDDAGSEAEEVSAAWGGPPPLLHSTPGECVVSMQGDAGVRIRPDFFASPDKPMFTVDAITDGAQAKAEWTSSLTRGWFRE